MYFKCLTVYLLAHFSTIQAQLETLKYYETLHASKLTHKIVKRGLENSNHPFNKISEIEVTTHGKKLRIILSPNHDILHSKFKAISDRNGTEELIPIDLNSIYTGRVFGESNSHVKMHIDNGVLTGSVYMNDDVYHFEPAFRHFKSADQQTILSYKESDLIKNEKRSTKCNTANHNNTNKHGRTKRNAFLEENVNKTLCPLLIVADHKFFRHIGYNSKKISANYLINILDRVNKIFQDTDFKIGNKTLKFGFVIKRIIIKETPSKTGYNRDKNVWDAFDLLKEFERENINKYYCLGHLVTFGIFGQTGIIGLGKIASHLMNESGGICSKQGDINENHNVAFSTAANLKGKPLLTVQFELTVAHELGHNWGANHDSKVQNCLGNNRDGVYLMHMTSNEGRLPNNNKFSTCSINMIRRVLIHKSQDCFIEPESTFCGNYKVEEGEDCDDGFLVESECCDENCKFKKHAVCSDRNSMCCRNCQFKRKGTECHPEKPNLCLKKSICTGYSDECIEQKADNNTTCYNKGICINGKCETYCKRLGLEYCQCETEKNACVRCCYNEITKNCEPVKPYENLTDGESCYKGYCKQGNCTFYLLDSIDREWYINEYTNVNVILKFLKDNIVGTVVLITAIFWVPSVFIINYIDKIRLENRRLNWFKNRVTPQNKIKKVPFDVAKKRIRFQLNPDHITFEELNNEI